MGERELCKLEVIGSIPFASTNWVGDIERLYDLDTVWQQTEEILVAIRAVLGSPAVPDGSLKIA